jgi:signal transduction protein with GAF and PtsI domain
MNALKDTPAAATLDDALNCVAKIQDLIASGNPQVIQYLTDVLHLAGEIAPIFKEPTQSVDVLEQIHAVAALHMGMLQQCGYAYPVGLFEMHEVEEEKPLIIVPGATAEPRKVSMNISFISPVTALLRYIESQQLAGVVIDAAQVKDTAQVASNMAASMRAIATDIVGKVASVVNRADPQPAPAAPTVDVGYQEAAPQVDPAGPETSTPPVETEK